MSGAVNHIRKFPFGKGLERGLMSSADWLHTNYYFPPGISLPRRWEKDLKIGTQHEICVISGFVSKTKEL